MRGLKTSIVGILGFTVGALCVPGASAQSHLTLVPSISLGSVYDGNLFALAQGDAGQMRRLRPGLETYWDSPRLKLESQASFDIQHSNHAALNSLDARRRAKVDAHIRTSPAVTIGLASFYDRTETPGELNFETGFLGGRQRAQRLELIPSIAYRFRPRTSFSTSYNWTTESLESNADGTLHSVRASLRREVTSRVELNGGYIGRRFIDRFDSDMSHALVVGATREVAPFTRLTVQAGPRISSYSGLQPEVVVSFSRGGGADVPFAADQIRWATEYWHGETIILGIRGPVAVDSATARIIFPLTRTIEFGTHFGASDSTTLAGEEAVVYRSTLVASWTPADIYTISGSYGVDLQHGTIRRDLFLGDHVTRHVFSVNLTIAPRISRLLRPTGQTPAARPEGITR